jgi:hypothetical protein
MAAQTGTTSLPIRPSRRKVGAAAGDLPEFSAQTFPIGCALIRTAGSVKFGTTGFAQSTGLVGFAINSGQNLATTTASGQKKAVFFRAQKNETYEGVLNTTWTGSILRGATAGISWNTAGVGVIGTGAGASSHLTIVDAKDWDNGVTVEDGDVFPVVRFILSDASIADNG